MFHRNLLKLDCFVYSLLLTQTFGMELDENEMTKPLLSQCFEESGGSYFGGPGGMDTPRYIHEAAYHPNQKHVNGKDPLSVV